MNTRAIRVLVIGIIVAGCLVPCAAAAAGGYQYVNQWGGIDFPFEVAVNATGFVYVADTYNCQILYFSPDGQYLGKWGSLGSENGQFYYPHGVAVNPSGTVFVADTFNNRTQFFSPEGGYLGQWGEGGSGDGQFYYPHGVAVSPYGFVYVADSGNNRTQVFLPDGGYLCQWGEGGDGNGQFSFPDRIAINSTGFVYVVDRDNHRIQYFLPDGGYLGKWGEEGTGDGQLSNPWGIAVNATGIVLVSDQENQRIQYFSPEGGYLGQWGEGGTGDGQFYYPFGIAVNSTGFVFVGDAGNKRIQVFAQPVAVSSISPSTSVNTGPVPVTITGAGFLAGASVNLTRTGQQNITATGVSVSPTQVTCTFPITGASAGRWNVTIKNTNTHADTLTDGFTITYPAPAISSVIPSTGVNSGAVFFTSLSGTGFFTGAVVNLTRSGQANITATGLKITSTKINGTFPITGRATGTWDLWMTNDDGQAAKKTEAFTITYPAPTISSITPNTGINTGPVTFTNLAGSNFRAGAVVNLTKTGQANITATGVVVTPTKVNGTLPITGKATGTWDLWVTNNDGKAVKKAGAFTITYPAPTISSITPATGINTGPVTFTNLTGTNFRTGAVVNLTKTGQANITATGVAVTPTKINGTLPISGKNAGVWDLWVTNNDRKAVKKAGAFIIIYPAPTISSITPATGINTGPVTFTNLAGTNFRAGAVVNLTRAGQANITATGVAVTPTKINGTLPITGKTAGVWDLWVTNADNQAVKKTGGFTIFAPPVIQTVSPSSGQQGGTYPVTITGTRFEPDLSTVTVSGAGVTMDSYTKRNATCIMGPFAITPSGATGPRTVTVTNPTSGGRGTGTFTISPGPSITAITPAIGANMAPILVVITGSGFASSTSTLTQGTTTITGTATPGKTSNATALFVTFPVTRAPAGVYNLTVRNAAGPVATKLSAFTIIGSQGCTITSIRPATGSNTRDYPVEITGTGFRAGLTVTLTNGVRSYVCTNTSLLGSTSIIATLPLKTSAVPAGVYSVTVVNTDGTYATKSNCYTVTAAATAASAGNGTVGTSPPSSPVQT